MYQIYKPLRNYISKHQIEPALREIWKYAKNHNFRKLQNALNLTSQNMLPWELELATREVLLNGRTIPIPRGRTIKFNPEKSVNIIRDVTKKISEKTVKNQEDAIAAIAPLIHQQMPWHDDIFSRLARYGKIYEQPNLKPIIDLHLGIPFSELLKIGLMLYGTLNSHFSTTRSIYEIASIPSKTKSILNSRNVDRFFELTTTSSTEIIQKLRAEQRYNKQWAYSFNHLRAKPIIFFDSNPDLIYAPIPELLAWRITDGIYYDLITIKESNFPNQFGKACEAYVGDVLRATLDRKTFNIREETPYRTKQGEKSGIDWTISDPSGHIFIECKAKRMSLNAKAPGAEETMDGELGKMSDFIVQNYKNIQDAIQNKTPDFEYLGLPAFSFIATLENWWIETPNLKEKLDQLVNDKIKKNNLPETTTTDIPYRILSFFQLERTMQDVCKNGIATTLSKNSKYEKAQYKGCLFPHSLAEIMPDIAKQAGLDRIEEQVKSIKPTIQTSQNTKT